MWQRILNDKATRDTLTNEATSWAACNGLVVSATLYGQDNNSYTHAPFTLLPSLKITKSEYSHLTSVSKIYHKLINNVARDPQFLIKCLSSAAKSDPDFLGKLLKIYQTVLKKNIKQPYYFGIFRNDFMKQESDNKWIQIEINTISAAGALMSDKTTKLHSYLIKKYNLKNENKKMFPESNENNWGLVRALCVAAETVHSDYLNGKYSNIKHKTILMIVSDDEVNISDQKGLEYEFFDKCNMSTLRRSLLYVYNNAILKQNWELYVDGCFISVIYFRDGYAPQHYKSDKEWTARLMMEESICIKCPNIEYQLIGSKLMQVVFCDKTVLKKYLNSDEIAKICKHFGVLKILRNVDEKLLNEIKNNSNKYVLKHIQREGGGNNLYENDIVDFIENKMNDGNVDHWLVMERIYPKSTQTVQIRNFKQYDINGISEFGVFSTYISNGKGDVKCNEVVGTMVRTKPVDVAQGGVFSGYAVFDSVITDDKKIKSAL